MSMDLLNSNTDLSYSGFIQKTSSLLGQPIGGGLFGNNAQTQILNSLPAGTSIFDIFRINPNDIQVFNDTLDFFLEGQREKREGIDSIGKINWISANIPNQALKQIYIDTYLKAYEKGDLVPADDATFNNILSYYREGLREQKDGISPIGKINFISNNDSSDINKGTLYAIYYLLGRKDQSAGMSRILTNGNLSSEPTRVPTNNLTQPTPIEVVSLDSIPRPRKVLAEVPSEPTAFMPMPQETPNTIEIRNPKSKPVKSKPISQDNEDMGDDTGEGDMEDETMRTAEEDGKILGMPKGVAIGLGIGVAVIGGLLIFKRK
jgi:hypothetical protein